MYTQSMWYSKHAINRSHSWYHGIVTVPHLLDVKTNCFDLHWEWIFFLVMKMDGNGDLNVVRYRFIHTFIYFLFFSEVKGEISFYSLITVTACRIWIDLCLYAIIKVRVHWILGILPLFSIILSFIDDFYGNCWWFVLDSRFSIYFWLNKIHKEQAIMNKVRAEKKNKLNAILGMVNI